MKKSFKAFQFKMAAINNYFFPKQHTISLHYSVFNHNVMFYTRLFSLLYLSWAYLWCILTVKTALMNIIYLTMQGYFMTWLFFLLSFQDYIINGIGFHKNRFAILQSKKYIYYYLVSNITLRSFTKSPFAWNCLSPQYFGVFFSKL